MESLLNVDQKKPVTKSALLRTLKNIENGATTIAIVDGRSCLREALAESLNGLLGANILSFDTVTAVLEVSGDIRGNIRTILFGVGAVDRELINPQLRLLRESFAECCIVVLSDHNDDVSYDAFTRYDVNGVIPTSYSTEQLFACLHTIKAGVNFLPSDSLESMLTDDEDEDGPASGIQNISELDTMLTPRQQQVLQHMTVGRSNKYIAAELNLCESTVKVHVSEIMRRLGATSRTHASYLISQMTCTFRLEPK